MASMRALTSVVPAILVFAILAMPTPTAAYTKRLMDCDVNMTKFDECDPMAYGIRAAAYAVPGIVVGLLMFFTCPFFFCARFCCGCCGGSQPSTGCCCANSGSVPLYSTMDIIRPKVYAFLLIALGVGVGIWGNLASALAASSMIGLADDVENAHVSLTNHLNRIESGLNVTRYDANTDSFTTDSLFSGSIKTNAEKARDDIRDQLAGQTDDFKGYVEQFGFAMFILFCLPAASVILGGMAALCNCRSCVPMLTAFLMFFVGFIVWLGHGVFSTLALVTGDVCAEVTGVVEEKQTVITTVSGCDDATLTDFMNSFRDIEGDAAATACRTALDLCFVASNSITNNLNAGRIYSCNTIDCSRVNFGDMVEYLDLGMSLHPLVATTPVAASTGLSCRGFAGNCTVSACAEHCRDSNNDLTVSGRLSKITYYNFLAAAQVSNALDTLGGEYGSCNSLANLLLGPFEPNCADLASSFLGLRQSSGLTGITAIGFIYVMAWGSKRFMALPSADEDGDEMHEMSIVHEKAAPVKDPSELPPSSEKTA